jgi:aminopeptidase N
VCHELAHFYFGDLITTAWWNELWLNEGFATFLEYLSVDHVHPEWDIWDTDWLYGNVGPMLKASQTHALVKSNGIVESSEQSDELFDSISYNKGGALLHMIYNVMGEEDFFEGLNKLCSDHAFGNVDTNDLWDALDSVKNGDYHIRERFDPWARQNGFPLVKAERISAELLRVTQTSCTVSSSGDNDGEESLWWIPLNMLKKDGHITKVVLDTKSSDIPISADDAWVKLNAGLNGIYRVQYDETLLRELGKAMEGGMNSVMVFSLPFLPFLL